MSKPFYEQEPVRQSLSETSPAGARTIHPEQGAQFFAADNKRPVILFDGSCNLCNAGVNFMLDWDIHGKFRLSALQSEAGQQLLMRSGRSPGEIGFTIWLMPSLLCGMHEGLCNVLIAATLHFALSSCRHVVGTMHM